ncbi:hypothetical protein WH8501_07890 [Crocosphaera watsonii WH 8501]|uniref:Uncharacterized protein n=5 Tax=Crocosphaera watsonii TaxID=263511 RepID=T2JIV1_CROWT|nr:MULTISPECIES: hypothetical protein [Crocosphaera]EHJ13189.1 hypothetical protein CWATWH0003_2126 [Crocosphaera watsonii WH 0003]MCH2243677.1 hypothetical protein [Crocosphaera sp.]NQZ63374.1 hypothetical protein [Crocosphaera sp.]CCQ51322.1 hypothetical protein CWATWH8502_4930 [Crocosphaera watsonii WH 8502]CCQ53875.1 hypothetical protein CWATWH0005_1511 [Crocosphaera watsonii WH 0005]
MIQVTLSQDILSGISKLADQFNLSVDELLQEISQGKLTVIDTETLEDLLDVRDAIIAEKDPDNQERVSWEDIKQDLEL